MHRSFSFTLLLLPYICFFGHTVSSAQDIAPTTYTFEAGEVLDLLLISQEEGADSTMKSYFLSAYPIAKAHGYAQLPGHKVATPVLDGTCQPDAALFGRWPSVAARQAAVEQLETDVPRFHEMRREIWPTFFVAYWELTEATTFTIDRDQYNVFTAYWTVEDAADAMLNQQAQAWQKLGGQAILTLTNAQSPFRYRYTPSHFYLTSWPSEAAYRTAQEQLPVVDQSLLVNVHEFALN